MCLLRRVDAELASEQQLNALREAAGDPHVLGAAVEGAVVDEAAGDVDEVETQGSSTDASESDSDANAMPRRPPPRPGGPRAKARLKLKRLTSRFE